MAGNAIEATSIPDAISAMEGILTREEGPPNGDQPAQEQEQPAAEAEATPEPTTAETAPAEAPEGEAEPEAPAEGEDTGEEGQAAEAAPEQPALYDVKIDGKREKVTLQEALNGYQRSQDYYRKTEDLANQRKAFESDRQSVSQERAQYQTLLGQLAGALQAMQPQRPDRALLDSDPIEYTRQQAVWVDHQERLQAAQAEQQRIRALQEQEQQGKYQQQLDQNRQKMVEAVPHWKDPAKWQADRPKLLDYGKKLGFTDQELAQASDYRAVVALYKAMQYDTLMARGQNGHQPRPIPRSAPRVVAAGNANTAPRAVSQLTRQKQRLARTGKVSDAAPLMEALLE